MVRGVAFAVSFVEVEIYFIGINGIMEFVIS